MLTRTWRVVAPTLALAIFCGCAEDGSLLGDGDEQILPTLASIQENVFSPICTACHFPGGAGPMPLDSEDASYQNLVQAGFSYTCAVPRVDPGNPDGSCIVMKIEWSGLYSGNPMPPTAQLPREQIDAIREWIAQGAPR